MWRSSPGTVRVYTHPVVVSREGADLIVRGSNRPTTGIRADQVAAVVLHVQQAAQEPAVSDADRVRDLLGCSAGKSEVDDLGRRTSAARGCGREIVVRCVSRPRTGLQIQTESECRVVEGASWRSVVQPWRALDDDGLRDAGTSEALGTHDSSE
jgi:hypothetical protein